jgi:hypothetical protein
MNSHARKENDIMKKFAALMLGCLLTFQFATAGQSTDADQKWLEAVQKMVANGEKGVSTPNEGRVNLLKEWGAKMGYAVKVTKTESGYSIEISKTLAQR